MNWSASFSAVFLSILSFTLYISLSFPFASLLKIRQSWITSTNDKPLWLIAFVNVWIMCGMSRAFVRATKVAFAARASFIGFIGLSKDPSGEALLTYPCCDVGVGCPVVSENDWLSCRISVMSALYLNA